MVQCIFHENILELWEKIFNAAPKKMIHEPSSRTDAKNDFDFTQLRGNEKKDEDADSIDGNYRTEPEEAISDIKSWEDELKACDGNEIFTIDKVDVPDDFLGKSFGDLFIYYLQDYNCVSIALYRWSSSSTLTLPHVVIAPSYHTKLQERDEVFILHPVSSLPQ